MVFLANTCSDDYFFVVFVLSKLTRNFFYNLVSMSKRISKYTNESTYIH